MSNFRSKAREIKAAGEAERGNFTPTGVPKRMYGYWLRNTTSVNGRRIREGRRKENFCHFWRVVAIWAPVMFLKNKAEDFVTSKVGAVSMVLAALAAIFLVVNSTIGFVDFLIGLGIGFAVIAAVMGLIVGGTWLHENKPKALERIFLGGIALAVLAFLVALVVDFGFIALAWVAGIIGGIALAVFILVKVGEWINGLRAIAREKARTADEEAWEKFYAGEGPDPSARPEPTPPPAWAVAIGNFFRGIGDFLILAGQVVRVKKWKICPMVEIPQEKIDYNSGWETA